MSTVDPYVVRYPDKITKPDGSATEEWKAWLDYDNRWKHDMWRVVTGGTGGAQTPSEDNAFLMASIADLRHQISPSLVVIDTTGFTIDNTFQTTDMTHT